MNNNEPKQAQVSFKEIPPPPDKPDPNECCGSGCVPCIYDYYIDRLDAWEALHGPLYKYEARKRIEDTNKSDCG